MQNSDIKKIKSLKKTLILRSLVIAFAATLASLGFVVLDKVDSYNESRWAEVHKLIEILDPNILRAFWSHDQAAMDSITLSIFAQQSVTSVSAQSEFINIVHEQPHHQKHCDKIIDLDYSQREVVARKLGSGSLSICMISVPVSTLLIADMAHHALPYLISISLITFFFVWMVQNYIVEPVVSLSQSLAAGHSADNLTFKRPNSAWSDELDQLFQELRQRTKNLETEHEISRSSLESVIDGVAIVDMDNTIIRHNPAFIDLLAPTDKDCLHSDIQALIPVEYIDAPDQFKSYEPPNGKRLEIAFRNLGSHGKVFIIRDMTERLSLMEKTIAGQKQQAIGTLASGIAHDFNNLLAVIQGNIEVTLMTQKRLTKKSRYLLNGALSAAKNGASLTSKLMSFGKIQTFSMRWISADTVLDRVRHMLDGTVRANITLTFSCTSRQTIKVDAAYLETALLNLILNAQEAIETCGSIHVSAEDSIGEAGNWVIFQVADDGCGIEPDNMVNILDPYYSTKSDGNGLGLPMVMGFAEQSGGAIEIDSVPEKGTTVTFRLPASQAPVSQLNETRNVPTKIPEKLTKEQPQQKTRQRPALKPRIMIVDDSRLVADSVAGQITILGGVPVVMESLDDVVAYGDKTAQIDFLLCDYTLEGHTGLDIFDYVTRHFPEVKFALMSGNITKAALAEIKIRGPIPILLKPFNLQKIKALVEEQLDISLMKTNASS